MCQPTWMLLAGLLIALVVESSATAQVSRTEVQGSDTNCIEILIPAVDGMIRWEDVAVSLGEAVKLDRGSIEKLLPRGQIDLQSDTVLLALVGINLAGGDAISFGLTRDAQNQPALSVKCDRDLFGNLRKDDPDRGLAGIHIDDGWQARSNDLPLVVLLHGLQSSPEVFNDFRAYLRGKGFATAAVRYDCDQSIAKSAADISSMVERLCEQAKTPPRLALVGHSMGGLVAREWTENETLSDPRIVGLVTIGTPHRGSNWASLPPLLDLFTSGEFDRDDLVDVILHQPSAQGLRDLAPGSDFLNRMSSRPRRPGVAYTTIVGTGSPIDEQRVIELRTKLRKLDRDDSFVRLIRPRIRPLLESFDELSRGKGDGVVATDRATIEGCDDIVIVDLSHFAMIRPVVGRVNHPVWQTVAERLARLNVQ